MINVGCKTAFMSSNKASIIHTSTACDSLDNSTVAAVVCRSPGVEKDDEGHSDDHVDEAENLEPSSGVEPRRCLVH